MNSPAFTPQPITLVHSLCLLEEPAFGGRALALLLPGEYLTAGAAVKGFVPIQGVGDARGYVPAAACAPNAAEMRGGEPPTAGLMQNVALYRTPTPGDQFTARWIVNPDEPLRVLGRQGKFIHVQRPDGQVGYVPQVLCREPGTGYHGPPTVWLVQPVSLYGDPVPGSQLETRWTIAPSETLLLLGRDGRFALVQRDDGQIGYVPSVLVGQAAVDVLIPLGPVDLGWITVGGVWGLVNWGGIAALLAQLFVDTLFGPLLGLAVLAGVVGVLWFVARRRIPARSFALGLMLAYAFLHLASGGRATLWR
jgi:hypothetical protein